MAVSYKKLWHLLIDKNMKKKDLQESAKLTQHAMRKLYTLAGILSLSEEEKESIRQQALEGDPVACYKLAEIYLHLHECEGSLRRTS